MPTLRFMNSYIVGGAVRDEMLGLPVSDRDWVVVGADPGGSKFNKAQEIGTEQIDEEKLVELLDG